MDEDEMDWSLSGNQTEDYEKIMALCTDALDDESMDVCQESLEMIEGELFRLLMEWKRKKI